MVFGTFGAGKLESKDIDSPPSPNNKYEILADRVRYRLLNIENDKELIKLLLREIRSLGLKFIIRLTLRTHEIITDEIIKKDEDFSKKYVEIFSFLVDRGLEDEKNPLILNNCIGFNTLQEISSSVIRAIMGRKKIAPSSIKSILDELKDSGLIRYVRKDELKSEMEKRVRKYVKLLTSNYDNINEDKLIKKVEGILKYKRMLIRSIICTSNPEIFDGLYDAFIRVLKFSFENDENLVKELKEYIGCRLSKLEVITNRLRDLEESLQRNQEAKPVLVKRKLTA